MPALWPEAHDTVQEAVTKPSPRKGNKRHNGININNLGYADDTTHMAESKEELKSLLTKAKEESEKAGLKLNVQKMKIMASSPTTSWQIDGETMETVTDFILGLQNRCEW